MDRLQTPFYDAFYLYFAIIQNEMSTFKKGSIKALLEHLQICFQFEIKKWEWSYNVK